MCCSVLQYVAMCCSVLPCVAVCCSVLQVWYGDEDADKRVLLRVLLILFDCVFERGFVCVCEHTTKRSRCVDVGLYVGVGVYVGVSVSVSRSECV